MSGRTIVVGFMAAFCGICATVGVMMLMNQAPETVGEQSSALSILVAKVPIEAGEKVEENMVSSIEWHSEELPPHSIQDSNTVIGSFAVYSIEAGDLILESKISAEQTTLLPAPGKFAFTIASKTESSNLGRNLMPGNRVDVLWTTSDRVNTDSDQPVSMRLLQNVKILAVGQVKNVADDSQKSITLEVAPKMDENLSFAQAYGDLTLSLRNPKDDEGIEPKEVTNLRTVLAEYRAQKNRPARPTALENTVNSLLGRIDSFEKSLLNSKKVDSTAMNREALERIKKGMRAITIQTPNESSAVAGLLEPGDRIDLVLTVKSMDFTSVTMGRNSVSRIPSETLIENVEILAVDTKLEPIEGDDQKKMSRSVTLIIKDDMKHDISQAMQMGSGSLTIVLRGTHEDDGLEPRTVMTVDDFVQRYMTTIPDPVYGRNLAGMGSQVGPRIRTLRGGAVHEIPFASKRGSN